MNDFYLETEVGTEQKQVFCISFLAFVWGEILVFLNGSAFVIIVLLKVGILPNLNLMDNWESLKGTGSVW